MVRPARNCVCTLSRDKPHPTNPPAISPLLTLTLLRSQGSAIVDELALQGQCRKNAIVESVCQSLQEGEDEGRNLRQIAHIVQQLGEAVVVASVCPGVAIFMVPATRGTHLGKVQRGLGST